MIGVIVQARMNSVRLPGKVMKPLPFDSTQFLIHHIIDALLSVDLIDRVIVATTNNSADDVLFNDLKNKYGKELYLFRGHEDDVLGRYYFAAKENNLQTVFRVTADNPFVDTQHLSDVYKKYKHNKNDYLTTSGNPLGCNVEVFNFISLEKAYKQAILPYDREHVTCYIRNNPELFDVAAFELNNNEDIAKLRLTVDSEADYLLMCCIFDQLKNRQSFIGLSEIRALYKLKPWIFDINRNGFQKKQYLNKKAEMLEAVSLIKKLDMPHTLNLLNSEINLL